MSMFKTKKRADGSLASVVGKIQSVVNRSGASLVPATLAGKMISLESFQGLEKQEAEAAVEGLTTTLESLYMELAQEAGTELNKAYKPFQREAGLTAAVLASDIHTFLHTPVTRTGMGLEANTIVVGAAGDMGRMKAAVEAYDEKENRNAVVYSMAYNMQAARQDEFGEAFFPTVTVTPDQVGFGISIRLTQVYDEVRRNISGEVSRNFGKRNIIHALIDPTILKNDQTRCIPVVRTESEQYFVDPALVTPAAVVYEGQSVMTAPLAVGKKFSLLGISQTEALLETGILDGSDALDPAIQLSALYLAVTNGTDTEVIKFGNVGQISTSNFVVAQQGNYRQMNLHFDSNAMLVSKNVKQHDGAASALLAPLVAGEYNVRLSMSAFGSVNLELADTTVQAGDVQVYSVSNANDDQLPIDAGAGKTIADLFVGAKVVGYDLIARRTNSNRRERGQMLDLTFVNMLYNVPLLSGITVPRPLTTGDQNDASDLASLITATHIRTSNAAVDKLLEAEAVLREYVSTTGGLPTQDPEILGVARFLVAPFYEYKSIDMSGAVDSLTSTARTEDVQSALVNHIRDVVYRMYVATGWKPAADALAGGVARKPTIIIGTDPYIANYLMVTGDMRTLGNEFDVKIVSTWNERMAGKVRISFGEFGEGKEGVPNPMHFGNMAWKPELVLSLPLHRNGSNSKELSVQPSFLHVVNLPVMAAIDVTGITESMINKNPVHFHNV